MVRDMYRAITDEHYGLSGVRHLICTIARERAWERFIVPETGEIVEYGPRACYALFLVLARTLVYRVYTIVSARLVTGAHWRPRGGCHGLRRRAACQREAAQPSVHAEVHNTL